MDKATEHKQWEFCVRCGAQMIPHPRLADQGGGGNPWLVCPKDEAFYAAPLLPGGRLDPDRPEMVCFPPKEFVPFEQLAHGSYYRGKCRNAQVARWNAETQKFVYMREKFGHVFPEDIGYWVEAKPGEHRFDEFRPYALMDTPPFEIPLVAR